MSGIIILSKDCEIYSVVLCKDCIHNNGECNVWGKEVSNDGWCYKGEEEDTNDLYEED